jgi:hypothetical protein
MKKIWILGLLVTSACTNSPKEDVKMDTYPKAEIFEMELGENVVYGVMVKDSTGEYGSKVFQVSFKLNDKVWYDTLILETSPATVIQGESVFADAVVNDMGGASFEINEIELN